MHPDDWICLSVGLADIWPPLKDSCSCHLAHTQSFHFVGPLYHLPGMGPYLFCPGVSSACCTTSHRWKQCFWQRLVFAPFCPEVPWICSIIFQDHSLPPSCLWRSCGLLFFLHLWVVFCCRVSPSRASRQRCRHPARNSANFTFPPPMVQVAEDPSFLDFLPKITLVINLCIWWRPTRPHIDLEESIFYIRLGHWHWLCVAICFSSLVPTAWVKFHLVLNFSTVSSASLQSFSCLWSIQSMTQGFDGFLLLVGGCWCGCGAGCREGAGPGFKCVLFCMQIMMKI